MVPIPRGAAHRVVAQSGERIALRIELARRSARAGRVQQVTVLGHEQEDQPVDQPEEFPVVVLRIQSAGPQRVPQFGVALVGKEAPPQR